MTSIGFHGPDRQLQRHPEAHDWKRRSERLVRASGHRYTIVPPGWFDHKTPDQVAIDMLQRRHPPHRDPEARRQSRRRQIPQVLVASLTSEAAERKDVRAGRGSRSEDPFAACRRTLHDDRGQPRTEAWLRAPLW